MNVLGLLHWASENIVWATRDEFSSKKGLVLIHLAEFFIRLIFVATPMPTKEVRVRAHMYVCVCVCVLVYTWVGVGAYERDDMCRWGCERKAECAPWAKANIVGLFLADCEYFFCAGVKVGRKEKKSGALVRVAGCFHRMAFVLLLLWLCGCECLTLDLLLL